MKKLKCLALLFVGVLLFGSCSLLNGKLAGTEGEDMSRNNTFRLSADDEISDAMFTSILEAIKTKDSEAIKGLFSKQALAEDKNIDASIEYLFNLFDGEVVSWERDTLSSDESFRNGKSYNLIHSWYTVNTKDHIYLFLLLNYERNTINPDLQGLYTLHGIDSQYAKTQWGNWVELEFPGVYMPGDIPALEQRED